MLTGLEVKCVSLDSLDLSKNNMQKYDNHKYHPSPLRLYIVGS